MIALKVAGDTKAQRISPLASSHVPERYPFAARVQGDGT